MGKRKVRLRKRFISLRQDLGAIPNFSKLMTNLRTKLKVILVDLDGVLCKGEVWNKKQCSNAKPIKRNIKEINRLYRRHFIIIYTARRDYLIPATLKWLRINNVNYMAISNKKCSADIYIDDKSILVKDIKKIR